MLYVLLLIFVVIGVRYWEYRRFITYMFTLSHRCDCAYALEQYKYLQNTQYIKALMQNGYPKSCGWSVMHDVAKNTPTFMESLALLKPLKVNAVYPNYIVVKFEKYKLI